METERVHGVVRQLAQTAEEIQQSCSGLLKQVLSTDWEGASREDFVNQCEQVLRNIITASDTGLVLSQRLQREANEWELVDSGHAGELAEIGSSTKRIVLGGLLWGIPGAVTVGAAELIDEVFDRTGFTNWWTKLSRSERIDFLREQHAKIMRQYGFQPIAVDEKDLPDDKGDAHGVHFGDEIQIDVDDIDRYPPWKVLNTLAHETRHELQERWIDHYEQTGEVPKGMTREQMIKLQENNNNYVDPKDDFEGYWKQPVEADAREFGTKYAEKVLENREWKNSVVRRTGNKTE